MNPTRRHAVAGLLAAAAGVGTGHLVAALVAPHASPVLAIGSTVIDATPTPLKEWAVSTLGTADKPILLAVVTLVTLAASAALGVLVGRRRTLGLLGIALLAALAALAAWRAAPTDAYAVLPGFVAGAVGVTAAAYLVRKRGHPFGDPTRPPVPAGSTDRRRFLIGASGVGTVAVASGALGQSLAAPSAQETVTLPAPVRRLPAPTPGLETERVGISALRTPNADFYRIDTALVIPRIRAAEWSLRIDGDVDNPFTLTWAELLALPMVEADITLTCVSNPVGGEYAGSARWLGTPVRDLLARAGVRPSADQILSTSDDGMTISTPVQALTDGRDALLAIGMNGRPLPASHGFPARLVVPGLYGFVSATKWVTRLTATTYAAQQAYWTKRGWAERSPILTSSRIDTPRAGARLDAGSTFIGGVAWAQHTGITGVEVRIDDGEWQQATLGPDAGIDSWRQWYLPWEATPGRHTFAVRATDATGQSQTEALAEPFPRGATGWHTVSVEVS
ncbi:MAG: molybdopterin-dependent oxidoreductase [Tetrasphaera sp.]|nr:molybdopterin-dependent oxidoreductase [Tetrasphaera sp.]